MKNSGSAQKRKDLKGVTCRKGTVTEVDTYCSAAFCNGVDDRDAIAR